MASQAIVPVEEKMNKVVLAAPVQIGRVVESEINTDEESTSTQISKDTDNSKFKEQSEQYEAKGSAVIIGTSGKTESSMEAKSKESEKVSEISEGNRKVFSKETSSSQSYSFEESTEYEVVD